MSGEGGTKHDSAKPRWDLVPWDAVGLFVDVLTIGAQKYSARNWEKGITFGRLFAAAQRHLVAWWGGEDVDPDTGKSHLAHAVCNIFFLLAFVRRERIDLDDRPRGVS